MNENLDWIRTLGVNGGVLATVTLTELEMVLSIVLLSVTITWTTIKIVKLFKEK